MGDVGVSVVVLQEKIGGTAKKKAPAVGGGGNGLSWQALSLLVASVLLVFFAATLWYPRHSPKPPPRGGRRGDNHSPILKFELETDVGGCVGTCAQATCGGFKDLAEMQKAVLNMKCETLYSLTITSSSLGETLEKNWLPESVYVQFSITLDHLDLTDIAADAFTGPQLSNVSDVVLSNLPNVTHLRRQIFRPFGKLEGIRLENLHGLSQVDNGIVSGLASTRFNVLQFTSDTTSIAELIPSFTGHENVVPHLVEVVYTGDIGTLRFGHLEALNLDAVTMIILTHAGIASVENGTLVRDASGVQKMVLQWNKLKTLSREAVDIGKFPQNSVFLEYNPWDCTCHLAWLLQVADHINDDPECETPAELKGKRIKELEYEDFCGTTVTPTPPEETTADAGTSPPPATSEAPKTCTAAVVMDRPDGFRMDQILTETPNGNVLVSVPDPFSGQILQWSGDDDDCFQVDVGRRRVFEVSEGLRRGGSYTFCFLEEAAVVIHRCFPITLLPEEDDRPWLTNGVKVYAIVGAVLACVVALLCPGVLIVAALRRWPWLMGKHIVVVKWRRSEDTVLAMPRDYEATTPSTHHRASTCVSSGSSDAATYVTVDRPTACQYASYYIRRVGHRLGHVFRRGGGSGDEEFSPPPPRPEHSRRTSEASTVTSDEGNFGVGRRWPAAPQPAPAWVRRPDLKPWSSRQTFQFVRVSATSGIWNHQ